MGCAAKLRRDAAEHISAAVAELLEALLALLPGGNPRLAKAYLSSALEEVEAARAEVSALVEEEERGEGGGGRAIRA
jgi:flagellar motor component MotA